MNKIETIKIEKNISEQKLCEWLQLIIDDKIKTFADIEKNKKGTSNITSSEMILCNGEIIEDSKSVLHSDLGKYINDLIDDKNYNDSGNILRSKCQELFLNNSKKSHSYKKTMLNVWENLFYLLAENLDENSPTKYKELFSFFSKSEMYK